MQMKSLRRIFVPALVILIIAAFVLADAGSVSYPRARADSTVETLHGTEVQDPYRWLEDPESSDTKAFVQAQNEIARRFVDGPLREQIKRRLTLIWDYPRYTAPAREGEFYVWSKNDGLQQQSVLYVQPALEQDPRVLIDPNTFSDDGTIALAGTDYTEDGALLAYGVSVAGSDHKEIRVRSVAEGKDLGDVLKWCRFSSTAWKHDNSGFFYNRYPVPGSVPKEEETFNNKVYWHRLGTPQEQDQLVYEHPQDKELSFGPSITKDGKYVILWVSRGSSPTNRIWVREVDGEQPFTRLIDEEIARFRPVGNDGTIFYLHSDHQASRGKLIAVDLNNPQPQNWKVLIPEAEEPINWVRMVNDQFVVCYLRHAHHVLKIFNRDGSFVRDVELPTVGRVSVTGQRDHSEMFVSFESLTYPDTIFRYDFKTGQMSLLRKSEVKFDADKYETKQTFARSKDGTRVPVFVAHKKGLKLDGSHPLLMNGYGGFNVGVGPNFSHSRIAWLEQGGIYAVAVLRGGNEYGEAWHRAGMLANKQNVFDDFIAAAEHLCNEGYTNPRRLAIEGRSNGGLLTAACALQRPDLFGAVISHVPVTDMLRYHLFTAGRFWVHEYGNAQTSADHFKFMLAYSPLHNVKEGATYPPMLVTTAEGDDRVVPLHARKFVATMQAKASNINPVLLLTQTKAGHGGGKPTTKIIDELADQYAFLAKVFGMDWKIPEGTSAETR